MVKEIINMCVMEGDTYMRMDIIKKRYKLKVSSSNTCFIHIGRYEVAEGNFGWIQLSYHRILPILFFFFFFFFYFKRVSDRLSSKGWEGTGA